LDLNIAAFEAAELAAFTTDEGGTRSPEYWIRSWREDMSPCLRGRILLPSAPNISLSSLRIAATDSGIRANNMHNLASR